MEISMAPMIPISIILSVKKVINNKTEEGPRERKSLSIGHKAPTTPVFKERSFIKLKRKVKVVTFCLKQKTSANDIAGIIFLRKEKGEVYVRMQ